jgi:subtilase family serine protease
MKKTILHAWKAAGFLFLAAIGIFALCTPSLLEAKTYFSIDTFVASPPIYVYSTSGSPVGGLRPQTIKAAYHLPATGGSGTIAIITAYNSVNLAHDLAIFSNAFNLPGCTVAGGCLEMHSIKKPSRIPAGWQLESSLDTEWAHAIAPTAKILVIEAGSEKGADLLNAIDYARLRKDVVAISMSWGGPEFKNETTLDQHFVSPSGATFFASSGDNGSGASWPAVSPNVVAVGGTSLKISGSTISEKAWSGSGGGISLYEKEPSYQANYSITKANGMRAIPDVSYDADPSTGIPVYKTTGKIGMWYVVGGTSAGAPQWAAIKALGGAASNERFYEDKEQDDNSNFFRDIVSGTNGTCTYYCQARKRYDYVTGLGSPVTDSF